MAERLAFDGLAPLRDVIRAHGLNAKKSLGQNFILDLNLTANIAALAGDLRDRVIVEVGPGPGGLTRALLHAGAAKVIAIERDERCLGALAEISEHWPGRLIVRNDDALGVDWRVLLEPHGTSDRKPLLIANLPYGIATKLLIGWLETEPWPPWFETMTLMFQREVAERIVAQPSTKPYGRLSVIAQWRTHCDIAMTLKPEAFTPPPKVASAVVRFTPREAPSPPAAVAELARVSHAIFGQRRKMLRGSLRALFAEPEAVLGELGIDATARGETLNVAQIASLALALQRTRGSSVS